MEIIEVFNDTKKFCKYWWRYYTPRRIEYCDYEQECALLFFSKLANCNGDDKVALAKRAYKWKLLDMMRKNDDTRVVYSQVERIGKEFAYFSLDDIGLKETDKKVLEQVFNGYDFKEVVQNKHQLTRIRKIVGDYFEIAPKNRGKIITVSDKIVEHCKSVYVKNKEKLLMAAIEHNKKPVIALLNGKEVLRFPSLKDATISVGLKSSGSIRKSIMGLCKAKGYNWKYV